MLISDREVDVILAHDSRPTESRLLGSYLSLRVDTQSRNLEAVPKLDCQFLGSAPVQTRRSGYPDNSEMSSRTHSLDPLAYEIASQDALGHPLQINHLRAIDPRFRK